MIWLENLLSTLGMNILELFDAVIIGSLYAAAGLLLIGAATSLALRRPRKGRR